MNAIPVEFLHGLGQTPSDWDDVLSHLPDWIDPAASTIPSLSAPAHEPFSLDAAARWVLADVIDRSEDPAILVGISLGAQIAIRAAALEPDLVAGLVLSAPVARPPRALMKMQRTLLGLVPERFIAGPDITEGGSGLQKEDMLAVLDEVGDIDLRPDLFQIQCPALVLVGGDDRANRRLSGEVVESMQDATFQIVPGVGHLWNETHPDRFAGAITNWLRKLYPAE